MFHVPENLRVKEGHLASDESYGNNGCFVLAQDIKIKNTLQIIASDGEGWEHVSVSLPYRSPTWEEMCKVKDLFWDDEDCVIQYHPPKSEYVNNHPFCLHLWRPPDKVDTPPSILVGIKPK